jgi:vanillate O-demethylase monooxygenase subunit
MVDNLMDLTHEAYVHSDSIGQTEIDLSPVNTTVQGDEILTSRFMHEVPAPPFWAAGLRANGLADNVPVDRRQVSRFTLPANVHIDVGVAHSSSGGFKTQARNRASGVACNFMTPETETTHWYFGGLARDFKADDAELTETILNRQRGIFAQDFSVLESQQWNLNRYPDRRWLALNIDSGGVQARRLLERRIKQEQ